VVYSHVKFLMLLAVITSSALIRLLPYMVSGVPYHTDTWALLSIMELLVSKTPAPLTPQSGFDNYEIFWPGASLFSAIYSAVTNLRPINLMPFTIPLINALSTLMIIPLLRGLGVGQVTSLLTALLLGLAGGEALLGAGVTKEAYALPLLVTTLMLLNLGLLRNDVKAHYVMLVSYVTLVMTHHLTSVVAITLLTYLLLSYLPRSRWLGRSLPNAVATLVTAALILITYVFKHSIHAFPIIPHLQEADVISLIGYEVTAALPLWLCIASRKALTRFVQLWLLASSLAVLALITLATRVQVVAGAPQVSLNDITLLSPYIATALLAILGIGALGRSGNLVLFNFVGLWITGLLGIEGYMIFGTPGLPGEIYRLANFLYVGVVISAAYALAKVLRHRRRSLRILAVLAAVFTAIGSAYVVPYTALYSGPVGGSQRTYTLSDITIANWIKNRLHNETLIYGDLRLKYLLYMYADVDVAGGLNYLLGRSELRGCLVINRLINEVGYIASLYGIPVNVSRLTTSISSSTSVTYFDVRNLMICA